MSIGLTRSSVIRRLEGGNLSEEDKELIARVIYKNNEEIEDYIKRQIREIERKLR